MRGCFLRVGVVGGSLSQKEIEGYITLFCIAVRKFWAAFCFNTALQPSFPNSA